MRALLDREDIAREPIVFAPRKSTKEVTVSPDHVDGPHGFSVSCYNAWHVANELNALWAHRDDHPWRTALEENTDKYSWRAHFEGLRNDPEHHLGLGDVRFTVAMQEAIVSEIEELQRMVVFLRSVAKSEAA
jgi:hypothetical protein